MTRKLLLSSYTSVFDSMLDLSYAFVARGKEILCFKKNIIETIVHIKNLCLSNLKYHFSRLEISNYLTTSRMKLQVLK
ncbi:hypothetical protein RI065_10780 [Mycoplasmatota bacterium zrk1]